MWGRVIVAVLLVAAILTGGLLSLRHIENVCGEVTRQVMEADKSADEAALKSAFDNWKKHESYFSAVIPHNRVDAVTVAFQRSIGYCETKTTEEYHASLLELVQLINMVERFDRLSSRNIF